jgi:hypothetical protein
MRVTKLMLSQNQGLPEQTVFQQMLSPASFWQADYLVDSAWLEHGPFAFWLIDAIRPRTVVELGTHRGFSYFSFCQAIKALGLDNSSSCSAIDTWIGDKHTGRYGEDIYAEVSSHNGYLYSHFSSLLRVEFSEASRDFRDNSIDLLHIDGAHRYEDISRDWKTWLPKLSEFGVVLIHDIVEVVNDFGVRKLWSEICTNHPQFEFRHASGLGVICPKGVASKKIEALFCLDDSDQSTVRDAYHRLGSLNSLRLKLKIQNQDLDWRKETMAWQQDKLKWCEETMAWQQDKLKWCEETMAWQAQKIKQLDGVDYFRHSS